MLNESHTGEWLPILDSVTFEDSRQNLGEAAPLPPKTGRPYTVSVSIAESDRACRARREKLS